MSVLFQDGCDLYGTDEDKAALNGWTRADANSLCVASDGRGGGGALKLTYNSNWWQNQIPGAPTTFWIFHSHYFDNTLAVNSGNGIIKVANTTVQQVCRVYHSSVDQKLRIYDADNTLQATSTGTMPSNAWYSIQMKVVVHATTGSVEVWVNGVQFVIATSIDTVPGTGNAYPEIVRFGPVGHAGTGEFLDDITIWDDQGSNFNTWTAGKDYQIETNRCDANGFNSQWTRSAGANNYENVDETPDHDGDATYNYASTSGLRDRIGTDALSVTPDTIYNVRTRCVARKESAGAALLKVGCYSDATEDVSAAQGLSTSYTYFHHDSELDPDGDVAWTKAQIDALQASYEVV